MRPRRDPIYSHMGEKTKLGQAARLKAARRSCGLTQAAAGKLVRLGPGVIGNIENGTREVREVEELARFANAYGVNMVWLATGEGEWR